MSRDWATNILAAAGTLAAAFCVAASASAALIVNDTWKDGTRNDPAPSTYSEYGTDSDTDGDIESAWFLGGDGSLTTTAGGPLKGQFSSATSASSASWTTYFTPEDCEVNLANIGDQMKVTWVFTPTNVNASNGSQNMRIALVDSPAGARLAADGAPGSGAYTGYAMFLNFGQTTGRSTPFQLLERTNPGTAGSGAFLGTSGDWTSIANAAGFGNGAVGYVSGTEYTFEMIMTHNATNGLDVVASMSGGNINGTGNVSVSFTDATPNSSVAGGGFKFDTFGIRPSGATTTAEIFDTRLFKVEGPIKVPEPATLALIGLGAMVFVGIRRRG